MLLPLPLSLALQKGLDTLLKIDPDTAAELDRLDGKMLRITVSNLNFELVLSIVDRHIDVLRNYDGDVDTTITGSLQALMSLQHGNKALYQGDVHIEGDLGVAQDFKDIAAGVDIDWEELISPITGDAIANQLGQFAGQFGSWLERTSDSMRQNSRDYLQEETNLLVTASEAKHLYSDVDELVAAVDRLDARLANIERAPVRK